MKRIGTLACITLILLGVTAGAAGPAQRGQGGRGLGPNFVDANGDGICDHWQAAAPVERGHRGACAWCGAGAGGSSLVDIAARLSGLNRQELVTSLRSGKTFGDVMLASGKTVEDLVTAVVAERKRGVEAGIAAGRLSQEQASQIAAGLETHVRQMVSGGWPGGHGGQCPFSGGSGGHHGPHWE
jgi:hypothetical protein